MILILNKKNLYMNLGESALDQSKFEGVPAHSEVFIGIYCYSINYS
jgi:hypothetical protein